MRTVVELPAAGTSHVQVTATGAWETADRLAGAIEARTWLDGFAGAPPAKIGVELLWRGPPVSFCGTVLETGRIGGLPELVASLTAPEVSPPRALSLLADGELGPLEGAALGAVNAWMSVGPVTVWDGSAWREPAELLDERMDLRRCEHPVALEISHAGGWYAIEVSRFVDGHYRVDDSVVDQLAGRVREAAMA